MGTSSNSKPHSSMVISCLIIYSDHGEEDAGRDVVGLKRDGAEGEMLCCFKRKGPLLRTGGALGLGDWQRQIVKKGFFPRPKRVHCTSAAE